MKGVTGSSSAHVGSRVATSSYHLVNISNSRLNLFTVHSTRHITSSRNLSLIRVTPGTRPPIYGIVSCNGFGCRRTVGTGTTHGGRSGIRIGRVGFQPGVSINSCRAGGNRILHFLGGNTHIGVAVVFHNHRVTRPRRNLGILRHLTRSLGPCTAIRSGPGVRNHGVLVLLTPVGNTFSRSGTTDSDGWLIFYGQLEDVSYLE